MASNITDADSFVNKVIFKKKPMLNEIRVKNRYC